MSIKAVVQFLEKTSSEDALREDVATLLGIGDGDVSSAAEIDQEEAEALSGGRGVSAPHPARSLKPTTTDMKNRPANSRYE